jgi:hypothetical protein
VAEAVAWAKEPKWIKTSVQHLYRNRDSGRYYVRGCKQGKEIWRTLKTDGFNIAKPQSGEGARLKFCFPEP